MAGTLSPYERVLAAFEKRKTDRIAIYQPGCSSRVGSALLGRECCSGGGINQWREAVALWNGPQAHAEFVARTTQDARDLARVFRADLVRTGYWRLGTKPAKRLDEYTFLYGDPAGNYTVRQLDPETELYQVVEQRQADAPRSVDDLERVVVAMERGLDRYRPGPAAFGETMDAVAHFGPAYAVPSHGFGLAVPNQEALWIEAVAARPDLVERYLECQCVTACRQIEAQKDLPLRFILGGGDFCGSHGPNYSPRFFHQAMLPRLQRMNDVAHRYGKFTAFASDGDLWSVADDLFGASGTDAYFEIDRLAGMDVRALRTRYPNLTCFGNISTITLHLGSRDEVVAQCRDNAEAALELGGCLVGASNQIVAATPMANVVAMLDTLEEYH